MCDRRTKRFRARRGWFLVVLMSAALGAGPRDLPDELFVQSLRASLLKEPRAGAEQSATVVRGDRLEPLSKNGRWYLVASESGEAWIHELLVGSEQPMARVSVLADEVELGDNARRRASEITSAAASRGLTEAARQQLAGVHPADYDALSWLELIAGQVTVQNDGESPG